MTDKAIAPCPFCGAGETALKENGKMWTGMKYSEPVSVSVRHWCEPVDGQPKRMLERVGRDVDSAIAAWNLRAAQPDCRTCDYYVKFEGCTRNSKFGVCTNGDKYQPAPAVVLWRTE